MYTSNLPQIVISPSFKNWKTIFTWFSIYSSSIKTRWKEYISSFFNKIIDIIDSSKLQLLIPKYSFKIFIDVLVLSSYSYPVSLISFGIYSALKSTYLPKLISSFDDLEVKELLTFHDYDLVKLDVSPPISLCFLLLLGITSLSTPHSTKVWQRTSSWLSVGYRGKWLHLLERLHKNNTYVKGFAPILKKKKNAIELKNGYAQGIITKVLELFPNCICSPEQQ